MSLRILASVESLCAVRQEAQDRLAHTHILIYTVESSMVSAMVQAGWLTNINLSEHTNSFGSYYTTSGRFGHEGLIALYGVESLVVLSSKSKVAELILCQCHAGESHLLHRSAKDAFARSRGYAYIHQGIKSANHII